MSQSTASPDPFEFLKSLWGPFAQAGQGAMPMGVPGQSLAGMATPTLDPAELERRIAELKSVENWLNLNLNMVRLTIQGMEMQKAALTAMHTGMADSARAMQQAADAMAAGGATASSPASAAQRAADSWMEILRKAQEAADKARQEQGGGSRP